MQTFIVDSDSAGKNLVRVILSQYPQLGAGKVYQALRKKDIRINSRRQHADCPVASGDVIALYLADDLLKGSAVASYSIVYQDSLILIVHKKAGVTVHAAEGGKNQGPALIDQIREDLQEPGIELCHRLDRQTGGLLILARRPAALEAVRTLMQAGQIVKRYRCLVRGRPEAGQPVICFDGQPMQEISAWLEKDAARSDVYIHDRKEPGDLPVMTRYRILKVYAGAGPDGEDVSELEVELVTGRTHQIRAHFAHLGHPLLGDGKYGRNSYNRFFRGRHGALGAQQLYSTWLAFLPQNKGPLAYLAGRTFTIEPDFDWPEPGKEPSALSNQ